jgi:DNA-binding CsgD family transcriptional regulator
MRYHVSPIPAEQAAKLYAASPDPVLLIDPARRIRYANPAAGPWNLQPDMPLDDLLDPFSRPKARLLLDHVAHHGFASGWELNLAPAGPQLFSVTALEIPDHPGNVLLFLRDAHLPILTAQRLIEANAEIDAQNQLLSRLIETRNQELAALQARPKGQITLDAMAGEILSDREQDVLLLMAEGLSNQEIADRLVISLATVKTHVRHILQRLSVEDRSQAVIQALHRGLIHLG